MRSKTTPTPLNRLLLAGLLLALAVAALAVAPSEAQPPDRPPLPPVKSRPKPKPKGPELPRVRTMVRYEGAYRVDSLDKVGGAEKLAVDQVRPGATRQRHDVDPATLPKHDSGVVEILGLVSPEGKLVRTELRQGMKVEVNDLFLETVKGWTFEPSVDRQGQPVFLEVLFNFDVTGVEQREPKPPLKISSSWDVRFDEIYRLESGENVKLVPEPFDSSRRAFFLSKKESSFETEDARPPERITFEWIDGARGRNVIYCFDCTSLEGLVRHLGIDGAKLTGEPALIHAEVRADMIFRPGTAKETLVAELDAALKALAVPVRVRYREDVNELELSRRAPEKPSS